VLERRPDIARCGAGADRAIAQIARRGPLYFPSISLTGAFGRASDELSDLFKGPSKTWSFGGSVTGPIFTAGAISGQVRQAEAARKAALLSYESSIQSAFADVENALVIRAKTAEQLKAQERLVSAAGEYTRLAQPQYDGAMRPYHRHPGAGASIPAELTSPGTAPRSSLRTSDLQGAGGGWAGKQGKGGGTP
jgi:multidrug efflux system outer membrane protein